MNATKVALALGVVPSCVSQWRTNKRRIQSSVHAVQLASLLRLEPEDRRRYFQLLQLTDVQVISASAFPLDRLRQEVAGLLVVVDEVAARLDALLAQIDLVNDKGLRSD
jgi:hypothetical protein